MPPLTFERTIELKQHVGRMEDGTEVRYAMDEIFLNGVRAGYVGHKPTDPINIIRPGIVGDKETMAAIQSRVVEKFKFPARKVYGVPELTDEEALDIAEGVATAHHDDEQ